VKDQTKAECSTNATSTDDVDSKTKKKSNRVPTDIQLVDSVEFVEIPCHKDMCVVFASPPGNHHFISLVIETIL